MSGSYFLDSNVLIYTFDARAPAKRATSQALVKGALVDGAGMISFQVVQEFLNVATTRFPEPMSAIEATTYMDQVLMPLCRVFPSQDLYRSTLVMAERSRGCGSSVPSATTLAECGGLLSAHGAGNRSPASLVSENPRRGDSLGMVEQILVAQEVVEVAPHMLRRRGAW